MLWSGILTTRSTWSAQRAWTARTRQHHASEDYFVVSQCDCAALWSSAQFGLRNWPSSLLDVASLHGPAVGAFCFVRVLAETSAYRNEVYLFPYHLDVKVTSYTFSTRHGAQRFYSRTRPGLLNISSYRHRLLCSWRICRLCVRWKRQTFFVRLFISSTGVPDQHVWLMWRNSTTRPCRAFPNIPTST